MADQVGGSHEQGVGRIVPGRSGERSRPAPQQQRVDGEEQQLAGHGQALAYSRAGALDLLLEYFPANFVLTPEMAHAGEIPGLTKASW